MNRRAGYFITILAVQFMAISAWAQGYQPLSSGYGQIATPSGGQQQGFSALDVTVDKTIGQVMVNWPADNISFDQLQSIMAQFPGMDKLQVVFPNQSQWMTSPAELLNVHKEFLEQAGGLGFGAGDVNIPQLVFSSLATQTGLSGNLPGTVGGLAMLPITNMKNAMAETLEPVLREMRYQQLAFSGWMPDWMKAAMLGTYNFFTPYYDSTVNWVSSFF